MLRKIIRYCTPTCSAAFVLWLTIHPVDLGAKLSTYTIPSIVAQIYSSLKAVTMLLEHASHVSIFHQVPGQYSRIKTNAGGPWLSL